MRPVEISVREGQALWEQAKEFFKTPLAIHWCNLGFCDEDQCFFSPEKQELIDKIPKTFRKPR